MYAVVAFIFAAILSATAGSVPADGPPEFVPLGAYLSWERPIACAKVYGIDQWDDVNRRLDALKANNVNLLWVTNMAQPDLPRLIEECRTRSIHVLPSMGAVEARVEWRWVDDGAYYDKMLPPLVESVGDSETLIGWVLSDEPQPPIFPLLEDLRLRFRELDPNRFCTAVTMWPHTPQIPELTNLPVVCVDPYPFFGPNDPNGPHTDAASKSFYRRSAKSMIEAIGDKPAVGWVMGMCFSDIWGPRKYDQKGHLIGLPGSYLHWRCPTLPEMRWQVWEAFRAGAKGFICYTLAPESPNPDSATLDPPDVAWKDVLATEETDMGPNALTNPDGSVTPQLEELGRVYARIAPHAALIRHLALAHLPVIEADVPGRLQVFTHPDTDARYAIVVNEDLHDAQDIAIRTGERVVSVTDVLTEKAVPLESDFAGGSSSGVVALQAGDGTLLRVEMKPEE
ncbi:MAG: hypothetical protein GY851_10745 [bacterium]|nr:hypothetical protein [bacterium]